MGAGLCLLNDKVDIYVLDRNFNREESKVAENHLKLIGMAGIGLYSNFKKEGFTIVPTKGLGDKFLEYDYVIKY